MIWRSTATRWKVPCISKSTVDPRARADELRKALDRLAEAADSDVPVAIFPEGTRTAPGQRRKYGLGGGVLAERSGAAVIPVAHNAGDYWGFIHNPDTIPFVVGVQEPWSVDVFSSAVEPGQLIAPVVRGERIYAISVGYDLYQCKL